MQPPVRRWSQAHEMQSGRGAVSYTHLYILTGQYTEIYFPSKGVRYIAINDNVDTINGESELAPVSYTHLDVYKRQSQEFPIVKDTTPNMMNPRLYTTSYNKP